MKKKNLTIFDAGIAFLLSFVLAQFTAAIGVAITQSIMSALGKSSAQIKEFFNGATGYLLQALFMNIAFILVFVWYIRRVDKREVVAKPNSNTWKYVGVCVAIGVATMFLVSGALNYFQLLLDKIGYTSASLSYDLDSPKNYIISLISLAVIPAVCEELIFRGVLVNALKHKGKIFAVVLSSIMFSIFHFSPSQLLYPVCFGMILSIVYLRTNNILFPMLLHFINNALSLSIQYFSSSSGGAFTHSASMLIYSIITLAGWVVIMFYLFRDFINHDKQTTSATAPSENNSQQAPKGSSTQNLSTSASSKLDNFILYGSIAIMICLYIILI